MSSDRQAPPKSARDGSHVPPELDLDDPSYGSDDPDSLFDVAVQSSVPPKPESAPPSAATPDNERVRALKDLFSAGDFSGALAAAQALLQEQPEHPLATLYSRRSEETLVQMLGARLGAAEGRPRLTAPPGQLRWSANDPSALELIRRIDGHTSIADLIAGSGLPPLSALRILVQLLDQRALTIETDGI